MIIDAETGETKNVDHGQKLPAGPPPQRTEMNPVSTGAVATGLTQSKTPPAPKDRDVQLSQLQWSEDGQNAVLMGRSADNKDRWVMLLDASDGQNQNSGHCS